MTREKTTKQRASALAAKERAPAQARKIERALEIRKSSAKAREGKPLAFPANRMHP